MMIPVSKLIALFQTMYREHWNYVWGKAEKGCVDCAGAFSYAFSVLGGKIAHGSNTIARRYTTGGLRPISEAKPGMAAFKAKSPEESGYNLPDKFLPGGASYNGDLMDYYHIGLVDDDVRYVLNAKGEKYGFCRDVLTAKNGWDFVAYLKNVDYGGKDNPDEKGDDMEEKEAKVVLPSGASGTTVNMRAQASTSAQLIARVPVGDTVEVITDRGDWCMIRWNGYSGWMMSNYLEYAGQGGESGDAISEEDLEKIRTALRQIETASEIIGSIVGRG